jgi:hypothetical protein
MLISFEKALPSDQMSVAVASTRTTGTTAVPIKDFVVGDDGVPENITIPSAKIGEPDRQYFLRFSKDSKTLCLLEGIQVLSGPTATCRFHEVNEKEAKQEIARALSNGL